MAGQVYTWTDKQGVSHFSGRPPNDQASSVIDTTTPGPPAAHSEKNCRQSRRRISNRKRSSAK
ncbi:DUF4124 domain-containing protein [Azotobacter vinelandii]